MQYPFQRHPWPAFLLLIAFLFFQPSGRADPVEDRLSSLSVPGIDWEAGQHMTLSSVPAYVRPFSSVHPPVEVASALAAHTDIFQRVLSASGEIVLSGVEADWHWLAQIQAARRGTRGYVSALKTGSSVPSHVPIPRHGHLTWLPPQASRHFNHRTQTAEGLVDQSIYTVTTSSQALTAYVRRTLREEGWMPDPVLAGVEDYSRWRRKTARLILYSGATVNGSFLYVQHQP